MLKIDVDGVIISKKTIAGVYTGCFSYAETLLLLDLSEGDPDGAIMTDGEKVKFVFAEYLGEDEFGRDYYRPRSIPHCAKVRGEYEEFVARGSRFSMREFAPVNGCNPWSGDRPEAFLCM